MTLIQVKRGDASVWTAANPILAEGEFGLELDTDKFKVGTGLDHWNDLPYINTPQAAIDAKQSLADKGQPGGYASLDSSALVPVDQIPPGLVIDGVYVAGTNFQFTSGGVDVGDPVSLLVAALDGGSPTGTNSGYIDGGTI